MESSYKIKLGSDALDVNSRIASLCQQINEFIAISGSEAEIPINDVSKQNFENVIKFCELIDYKDLDVPKVSNDEIAKILPGNVIDFLKNNVSFKNLELFDAAIRLRIKPLIQAISAYLASQIHFKKNSVQDYQRVRDKLNVREITQEDSRKISEQFPLLNK